MLFSEVYSAYFNTVAAIISETLNSDVSEKTITTIIHKRAFSESILSILPALKNGEWAIFNENFKTPIKHHPIIPLTNLQKQWLKAISLDPRIKLFGVSISDLDGIEPLFTSSDFVFFDRYTDSDSFLNDRYVAHFKMILAAIREKRQLHIEYYNRHGHKKNGRFIPHRLEYSSKDDKFRLEAVRTYNVVYINLNSIKSCELMENYDEKNLIKPKHVNAFVRFLLKNERNALDRVMLHFSDCRKETRKLDNGVYDVKLWYEVQDETEILIRIFSFGPMLKVIAPDSFISLIKARILMQKNLFLNNTDI